MTRKIQPLCILLLLLCGLPLCMAAGEGTALGEVGITAAFPSGWTVVTPETVSKHFKYFTEPTADIAAANMRVDGVRAVAFSADGSAALRVIVVEGDEIALAYHDIDRYTSDMRNDIKEGFLNREAWALTGYRFTSAAWTNKEGQGRRLNLAYTIKEGETTIARGQQMYTVRGGKIITLDLMVTGRQIGTEDEKAFNAFVEGTELPDDEDSAPLLPVGLTFTAVVPEETHQSKITLRGETTKGALVSAWIVPDNTDAYNIGQIVAGNGGIFKLDVELPGEGEWRLYVKSDLEGYETSQDGFWIDYDKRRLPVTFTSYPEGDVYDSQIIISGKTISGVQIQCMEGETNRKTTTGSDGSFSFKMDRAILGDRTIVISFSKKNYDNRRFTLEFNRQWTREDYVKYLSSRVESLSYKNLTERPEKYLGRLVKYKGTVLDISSAQDRLYIQLGVKQDADGRWIERIIAVADAMEVLLSEGDSASLYFEVTGEFYAFPDMSSEGDEIQVDLPSVKLLTYEKHI